MWQYWLPAHLLTRSVQFFCPADKALEMRAWLLTTVSFTADPMHRGPSGGPTPWVAASERSPAAAAAAGRLVCDTLSQIPTEEDVRNIYGQPPRDITRTLPNDLRMAESVLKACDLQRLLGQGMVGVDELQTLTAAALRVSHWRPHALHSHLHAPSSGGC